MNIIKEQNDNLSAQIKINIDELDYNERVKKELNKLRGKVNMPGFRQGHVPFSLLQKMYGRSVLVDEINKILQESVGKFLEDEKIDLLGAPFPAQDSPSIDFENDTQFNFTLNVILSPEVTLDFLKTFPTTYYKIKATDAIIDEQITALRQRFGTDESVSDAIKEHDRLYCDYQSLENKDIQSDTLFFVDTEKNPFSILFIGHKVNDTIEIDMDKTFEENPTKACDMLNIKEEDKPQTKGIFKFTITEVKRLKECDINEDLFKKAYPNKEIKTEKELRKTIAETYSTTCAETVETWFFNAHFDPIVKAANLSYDDQLLRQYMEHQKHIRHEDQQEEYNEENTISDKEFENTKRGTSWQLIQQKLMETFDIKVEPDEIKQAAKEQISRYFGIDPDMADTQLGEYMNSMVDRIMKDEKQVHELYNRILDKKITKVLLENTQITTKEVTWDEFLTLIDAKKEEPASTPKKTKKTAAPTKKTKKENTDK